MTRLIDVDKIIFYTPRRSDGDGLFVKWMKEILDKAPTVDAKPVRHGHWIVEWESDDTRMLRCSKCRMVFNVGKGRDGNYCPECGARMDEDNG